MLIIKLETIINAPIERCFDLSLSIDLHRYSTSKTNEQAIAGTTSGLVGLNETVTWRAKHFGIWMKMKVGITAFHFPNYFKDDMITGPFHKMQHEHFFSFLENKTIMRDNFEFSAPLNPFSFPIEKYFLLPYMKKFLIERNQVIKQIAESLEYKRFLSQN